MGLHQEYKAIFAIEVLLFGMVGYTLCGRLGLPRTLPVELTLPALTMIGLTYGLDCPWLKLRARIRSRAARLAVFALCLLCPLGWAWAVLASVAALPTRTLLVLGGGYLVFTLMLLGVTAFFTSGPKPALPRRP